MKTLTVKDNLEMARKKSHKTMIKNGHYTRMAIASAKSRSKSKKLSSKK